MIVLDSTHFRDLSNFQISDVRTTSALHEELKPSPTATLGTTYRAHGIVPFYGIVLPSIPEVPQTDRRLENIERATAYESLSSTILSTTFKVLEKIGTELLAGASAGLIATALTPNTALAVGMGITVFALCGKLRFATKVPTT